MKNIFLHLCSVTLFSLSVLCGCQSPHQTIPTGHWEGRGQFIDYTADVDNDQNRILDEQHLHRSYSTSLTITRETIHGRDAYVFEILSQRGPLLNDKDQKTHIRMALVPQQTLDSAVQLLAMPDWKYQPTEQDRWTEENFQSEQQITAATCMLTTGHPVLQVQYLMPRHDSTMSMQDTFQFLPDRVIKTGSIILSKQGDQNSRISYESVRWVEELYPAR